MTQQSQEPRDQRAKGRDTKNHSEGELSANQTHSNVHLARFQNYYGPVTTTCPLSSSSLLSRNVHCSSSMFQHCMLRVWRADNLSLTSQGCRCRRTLLEEVYMGFLATPPECRISLTRGGTRSPCSGSMGILTTGPPGNFQEELYLMNCIEESHRHLG